MTVAEKSAGESGREAWEGMPRRVAAGSGDLGVRRKGREAWEGLAVPDAGALARPPFALAPVTVVTGHYGVGKTNLSLNLAYDAAACGAQVTLVDLDVVNPYFRSSDHADALAAQGVRLIAPVFAGKGSNLDVPSLTGAIAPAIEEAYAAARQAACGDEAGPAADARTPGGFAGVLAPDGAGAGGPTADTVGPTSDEAAGVPPAVVIVDAGGDDAGATALGRFAADVVAGPYALLYVVNRFRNLTQTPVSAAAALPPILEAAHLQATAVVNNSHVMGETGWDDVRVALAFGDEAARLLGLPLACTTVPEALVRRENGGVPSFMGGRRVYSVQRYVRAPWET